MLTGLCSAPSPVLPGHPRAGAQACPASHCCRHSRRTAPRTSSLCTGCWAGSGTERSSIPVMGHDDEWWDHHLYHYFHHHYYYHHHGEKQRSRQTRMIRSDGTLEKVVNDYTQPPLLNFITHPSQPESPQCHKTPHQDSEIIQNTNTK